MRHLLLALLVAGTAFSIRLRSGYSSEPAQQELSVRRFANRVTPQPKKPSPTGAAPALIYTHFAIPVPPESKTARSIRGRKLSL
jgi:hypothetical protein